MAISPYSPYWVGLHTFIRMKRYGTSTNTNETVRYFNGTVNGIMDNEKMIIAASLLLQRHHDLKNKLRSPTWRRCSSEALPIVSLQSRKFLFELSLPTVLAMFDKLRTCSSTSERILCVFRPCPLQEIPIAVPFKIETGIPRYFLRRFSVRCWNRVPVYSPTTGLAYDGMITKKTGQIIATFREK